MADNDWLDLDGEEVLDTEPGTSLVSTSPKEIVRSSDPVADFFTLGGTGAGLVDCRYTASEEVGILVEIARDAPRPADRIAAVMALRGLMRENLIASGGLAQATFTQTRETASGPVTASMTATRLRSVNTEDMLREAVRLSNVIEAARLEETTDAETDETRDSNSDPGSSSGDRADAPGPARDLGGGGLCESSRTRARADRERAGADAAGDPAGDRGRDGVGTPAGGGLPEAGVSGRGGEVAPPG